MKDGGPAFPAQRFDLAEHEHGMTLLDWFAGMALMGMMASRNPSSPKFTPEMDAVYVYAVARAMIQERSKT